MTAVESHNGHGTPTDPDALRAEIARTRSQLGETVEALAAKADVKARAQESVEQAKLRVRESVEQAKVAAVYAGRELKADPVGQLRVATVKARRSMTTNPSPWAVAAAFIALAVFVGYRRRTR
jgi:hypothetical protein